MNKWFWLSLCGVSHKLYIWLTRFEDGRPDFFLISDESLMTPARRVELEIHVFYSAETNYLTISAKPLTRKELLLSRSVNMSGFCNTFPWRVLTVRRQFNFLPFDLILRSWDFMVCYKIYSYISLWWQRMAFLLNGVNDR